MNLYLTITGQKHYFGMLPFAPGAVFSLLPDKNNLYDVDAISVVSPVYGLVGLVAQSEETRAEGTLSASSLLPYLPENAACIVRFIAGEYILAELFEKEAE